MDVQEAVNKYIEKFGGFPYFLFLGAPDEKIIDEVKKALETGQEIKAAHKDGDY